jgi:rhodanese-related sulfurtransferase
MGPFVPDIISDQLNLVFGFLIGIAFGFVLEQAGFSSSSKLTGLFYGRDFTVLRVFFSAAITAMIGVILLGYYGLLDTDVIYINPTFLWPAIVGGVIMGVGFVVGGYCPGTSVCGAAIGKIDAMVFVLGGLLGVYVFGEGFPLYDTFFTSSYLGDLTVPPSLGMSQGTFALLLVVVAVAAFIVTTKIERRLNPFAESKAFPVWRHRLAGSGLVAVGAILLFVPTRREHLMSKIEDNAFVKEQPMRQITADELAFRILDHDPLLQIIDVRDSASYARMPLPGSLNIPPASMFGKQWREELGRERKRKIIVANDEMLEQKAITLAQALGYSNFVFLSGGLDEFKKTILNVAVPTGDLTPAERDAYRFRGQASVQISELIKEQMSGPKKAPKLVKRIVGGCGA